MNAVFEFELTELGTEGLQGTEDIVELVGGGLVFRVDPFHHHREDEELNERMENSKDKHHIWKERRVLIYIAIVVEYAQLVECEKETGEAEV